MFSETRDKNVDDRRVWLLERQQLEQQVEALTKKISTLGKELCKDHTSGWKYL